MYCKKVFFVSLFLSVFLSLSVQAEVFFGKVVGVKDGDTIVVMKDGAPLVIRLDAVDAPESGQDFGSRAKQFVSDLCFGKAVQVSVKDTDKYGRTVAEITLPDSKSLNEELVSNGMAWWYTQYAPNNTTLQTLQEQAKTQKVGLWSIPNPTPPWDFRHGSTAVNSSVPSTQPATDTPIDNQLYVTKTGSKVHRAGCRYLKTSQFPITAEDAVARGYLACSVCGPSLPAAQTQVQTQTQTLQPVPSVPATTYTPQSYQAVSPSAPTTDETVYVTSSGKKHHGAGCRYLSKSQIPMNKSQAQSSGYSPCSVCGGG